MSADDKAALERIEQLVRKTMGLWVTVWILGLVNLGLLGWLAWVLR